MCDGMSSAPSFYKGIKYVSLEIDASKRDGR